MKDSPAHRWHFLRENDRAALGLAWILFLLQGFFYAAFLPPWEGFDEPIHLAYIAFLHDNGKLPVLGVSTISDEIQSSIDALPVSPSLDPYSTHRFETFFTGPQKKSTGTDLKSTPLYEAQQPPAYYTLMLLPYHAVRSKSILTRLHVVRFASVFVSSFFVFFAFGFIRGVLPRGPLRNLTLFATIAFPMLYANVARVSVESLALLLFTVIVYLTLRWKNDFSWKNSLGLGAVLGLGLLTKLTFLCALGPVLVVWLVMLWRSPGRRRGAFAKLVVFLVVAFGIAAPWFIRSHRLYHVWLLSYEAVALKNVSTPSLIFAMTTMPWAHEFAGFLRSFVWVGNWSFLFLPKSVYDFAGGVFAVAGIGIVVLLLRRFKEILESLGLSFLFGLAIMLASMQFATVSFLVRHALGGSGGWYFYPLIAPITVLLVSGLTAFTRTDRGARGVGGAFILSLSLINLYGMFVQMMPYYAGFLSSARSRTGNFRALVSAPWKNFEIITDRLGLLKPHWLDARMLRAGCFLFALAVVAGAIFPWMKTAGCDQTEEIRPSKDS